MMSLVRCCRCIVIFNCCMHHAFRSHCHVFRRTPVSLIAGLPVKVVKAVMVRKGSARNRWRGAKDGRDCRDWCNSYSGGRGCFLFHSLFALLLVCTVYCSSSSFLRMRFLFAPSCTCILLPSGRALIYLTLAQLVRQITQLSLTMSAVGCVDYSLYMRQII